MTRLFLLLFSFLASFYTQAQFSEKVSLHFSIGIQSNNQKQVNRILSDTNLVKIGGKNAPREAEFKQLQAYSVRVAFRPNVLWDLGITGRWQYEQIEHSGQTIFQEDNLQFDLQHTSFNRMEVAQIGLSSSFYMNALFSEKKRFEYGVLAELNYAHFAYQNYHFVHDTKGNAIIVNQKTRYRAGAATVLGRLGLHVSYGIPFQKTKISLGIQGGWQLGNSVELSNSAGTSFLNDSSLRGNLLLNGGYGSLFIKLSR